MNDPCWREQVVRGLERPTGDQVSGLLGDERLRAVPVRQAKGSRVKSARRKGTILVKVSNSRIGPDIRGHTVDGR